MTTESQVQAVAERDGALPSGFRLAWWLLAQPTRLDAYLADQKKRLATDPHDFPALYRRDLATFLVILALGGMTLPLVVALLCTMAGVDSSWTYLALAGGLASFVIGALIGPFETVYGFSLGISFGVTFGATMGAFCWMRTSLPYVFYGEQAGVAALVSLSAAFYFSILFAIRNPVARLPMYGALAFSCWTLSQWTRKQILPADVAARQFEMLLDDSVPLLLPGAREIIVAVGKQDPELGEHLLNAVGASAGQARASRHAQAALQAQMLSVIALGRRFAELKQGDVPFLPASPPADSPLATFLKAATELCAVQSSHNQHHRVQVLARTEKLLRDLDQELLQKRRPDVLERRLLPVTQQWLAVVKGEQVRLKQEQTEHPLLPECFIAGPALRKEPGTPFKGRRDLGRLVDHELASEQRGPLVLWGQRRMGKTSFLQMAPDLLGGGTKICVVNFQALSGSVHRAAPHSWICAEVASKMGIDPPPEGPWGLALEWLTTIDQRLATSNERLLVAIDEVERLEDEIRAGQTNHDTLDFVRAAGDRLLRVRILLVSGLPLQRLGLHWIDRIISAKLYELGYLEPDAAEELVRRPIPEFPDIYPEGGVERILEQTNCHPYLIQLICDQLVRRLNGKQRLEASMDDIEWAIDEALTKTALFSELWDRQMQPREQHCLRLLAAGNHGGEPDVALRELERHQFVVQENGRYRIAVPMFQSWIRDHQLETAER